MRLTASVLFACVALLLGVVSPVRAEQSFENRLTTTYTVSEAGTTNISHQFTIKNLLPTVFLKQYSLSLYATNLSNVSVEYKGKNLEPTITTSGTATNILITFPDDVVGEGKSHTFTVRYESTELAQRAGKVLEVQIPPFSTDENYAEHSIVLRTPFLFGNPVRISPPTGTSQLDGEFITTRFTNSNKQPIVAVFGTEQFFTLTLRYNLQNASSNPGFMQVALPPDTAYQRVQYLSLEPSTNDITVDADGNWIATYHIPPNTTQPVYLTANVRVSLEPSSLVPIQRPIPDHFADQKYWESTDAQIKELSAAHSGVEALYTYVVKNLAYSYEGVDKGEILPRKGARAALAQPTQAVCQEFTDLFVALARAQGIAARRLTGYAYTQNKALKPLSYAADVLHAWPEYFDDGTQQWKQVDPTWQNTTGGVDYFHQFDLNHITFAVNGVSSTTPYPAGSYKTDHLSSQDIAVELAATFPDTQPDIGITLTPQSVLGLKIPGLYTLAITNKTGVAWYNAEVQLAATNGLILDPDRYTVDALLPFQTKEILVHSAPLNGYSIQTGSLTISVSLPSENYVTTHTAALTAGPKLLRSISDQTRVLTVVAGGLIVAISAWGLLVFKRKR